MHYYPHHIGDFTRDTARLSDAQCMAYLRMIWAYYDTEKPLPDNPESLAFQLGTTPELVRQILQHYFVLTNGVWVHARCEAVIAEYHAKSTKARDSANARWKNANAMRTHTERNADAPKNDANQEPITKNQIDIGDATAPLPKTVTVKMLVSEGVEKQIAEDWLTLRKAKRLPLTHTAWADTKAEGEKVGLTPAHTVAHAVSSNWAGFKASWYAKESGNTERSVAALLGGI